jgi:NAD(P)-dependent dehydrogenase (short-subunit alcohol dehydrogenase family)
MKNMPGGRLAGRVAIVTGSGSGIGRAEALLMAREGARVVVNDYDLNDGVPVAQTVVDEIVSGGGEAIVSTEDVRRGAQQIVAAAVDAFGTVDILINNAGVVAPGVVEAISEEDWDFVVDTHLRAAFLLTRLVVPFFEKQGRGAIVNTCSESGLGHPAMSNYSAAKEGLAGFTRTVARELARFGGRCNAIRPRAYGTSIAQRYQAKVKPWQDLVDGSGPYRMGERGTVPGNGTPEKVAPIAVWLCTDAAKDINGVSFAVEGDLIGIWSDPMLIRSVTRSGGWDLDALDQEVPNELTFDYTDRFRKQLKQSGVAP